MPWGCVGARMVCTHVPGPFTCSLSWKEGQPRGVPLSAGVLWQLLGLDDICVCECAPPAKRVLRVAHACPAFLCALSCSRARSLDA